MVSQFSNNWFLSNSMQHNDHPRDNGVTAGLDIVTLVQETAPSTYETSVYIPVIWNDNCHLDNDVHQWDMDA
jgi:hypothetical protein